MAIEFDDIVTAGYYNDNTRDIAQMVVWNSTNMAVKDMTSWYWTDDTQINDVKMADIDGDDAVELITGGYYTDGNKIAQLAIWNATTMAVENLTSWMWTSDTAITSIAVDNVDVDADLEIITGGYFNDNTRDIAQLVSWNAPDLTVDNIASWYWTGDTHINAITTGNIDDDTAVEIITAGDYNDGNRMCAQLATWTVELD